MATQSQPVDVQVAVLTKSVDDCQREEATCRTQNRADHLELFDRMRQAETQLAVMGKTLAVYAALGSIVGGALVTLVMRKLFP